MFILRRFTLILLVGALVLASLPLAAAADEQEELLVNGGFEQPLNGNVIPGWTQTFGSGFGQLNYEVSSAQAYEGTYSLLMEDYNSARSLGVESDPVPVNPETVYKASAMVNVETGSLMMYLRYFDANGVKIGEVSSTVTPTSNQWQQLTINLAAPAQAEYARVLLYTPVAGNNSKGYFDQVRLEVQETGTFEEIGSIVRSVINEDGAIGYENGDPVLYTVFKGRGEVPTRFVVLDALTREVIRMFPLEGVEAAWGVKVATDNRVYIGTHYDGGLYRYTPGVNTLEHLGRFGSETHVFSMAAGPNGKMYAGTYPNGKLFEYDPATDQITDLGRFEPQENYVRSLAYDHSRDMLYVGIGGTKSRVYAYDPATDTATEILQTLIPGKPDQYSFPYGMVIAQDRLFIKFNNADLLVIALADGSVEYYDETGMDIHSESVVAVPGEPDQVMFTLSGNLYLYDGSDASFELVKSIPGGTNFWQGMFVDLNDPDWPGQTLVAFGKNGNILYYNLLEDEAQVLPSQYDGAPTLLQSLHKGPDGKIYAAGYMSGFASYDPVTDEVSDTYVLGQIESSVVRDGKMIIGAYAGARILSYDPSLPWAAGNPNTLFELRGNGQDRPFGLDYSEDLDQLFIGTVPNTSSLQGALAVYDFQTDQVDVFTNLVNDQSFISVLYHDGLVYAGTTIYGGLGTSGPTETEGKLIVFDPVTQQKVFETVPVPGRKGVTGLVADEDGYIWGVAEEFIFKFDPVEQEVVFQTAKLRRYGSGTTWAYAHMELAPDGQLYGTSRSKFFKIDPVTHQYEELISTYGNYLVQDDYGSFYFTQGDILWKYTPPYEQ